MRDDPSSKIVCPGCEWELVAKRGAKRTHHFAHGPGSPECAFWSPETRQHYEAKMRVAEICEVVGRLPVRAYCRRNSAQEGSHSGIQIWVRDWNRVLVEQKVDRIRPDVLLMDDDQPVAAIEIVVSNPVGSEKEERFRELRIPWLEVYASEAMKWKPAEALAVHRAGPQGWQCSMCYAERGSQRAHSSEDAARWAELVDGAFAEGCAIERWSRRVEFTHRSFRVAFEEVLRIVDVVRPDGKVQCRVLTTSRRDVVLAAATGESMNANLAAVRGHFKRCLSNWGNSISRDGFRAHSGPWEESDSQGDNLDQARQRQPGALDADEGA